VERGLDELEAALGHGFARRELLVRALTHRSLANQHAANEKTAGGKTANDLTNLERVNAQGLEAVQASEDNERLEFLGDAVLGLVVAEGLFEAHPEWHEGELTRVRAQLVSRKHLADVAAAIQLGVHLRLSRGEERGGLRNKSTVLSNSMEAVLGALFLDGGLDPVRAFARRYVMGEAADRLAEQLRSGAALGNFKSALQEFAQSARLGTPVYRVRGESGPDHRKRFVVEVRLQGDDSEPGQALAHGAGSTKKLAEQDAARRAIEGLKTGESTIGAEMSEAEEQAAE
jgi:ribonuclease-3